MVKGVEADVLAEGWHWYLGAMGTRGWEMLSALADMYIYMYIYSLGLICWLQQAWACVTFIS